MSFLTQLSWRYATKKFDSTKPVTPEQLEQVLEAIRLAPTSLGVQPFHVSVVTNPELKEKLRAHGYDQAQFTTASHILVFSARTDIMTRASEMIDDLARSGVPQESRDGLYGMIADTDTLLDNEERKRAWAARQAHIALGFGLAAAAELGIDSCPMEGFDPAAFHKDLTLPEHVSPVAVLALGNRAADDVQRTKFRFAKEKLFAYFR